MKKKVDEKTADIDKIFTINELEMSVFFAYAKNIAWVPVI